MPDGTHITPRSTGVTQCDPETVYAKQGPGWDRFGGCWQTTFLFADEACERPLGWVRGWYPDGHVLPADYGQPAQRLVLRGRI